MDVYYDFIKKIYYEKNLILHNFNVVNSYKKKYENIFVCESIIIPQLLDFLKKLKI